MKRRNKDLSEGNIPRQLFTLTIPMLFGMIGMVIFNLADTYFIGKLGVTELAAISFSFPVIMFINSLSQGIGIGTSSLVSRNIMVADRSTIKMMAGRTLLLGFLAVTIFVITGLFTVRLLFRQPIAGVFTSDANVVAITASYFLIVGASYGFQGLVILSTASFNGLNRPYPSAFFSMLRMLLLYVPLAWIGSRIFGLNGVFWAGLIANVIAGISAYAFLYRKVGKMQSACGSDVKVSKSEACTDHLPEYPEK